MDAFGHHIVHFKRGFEASSGCRVAWLPPDEFELVAGDVEYYQGQKMSWKYDISHVGHIGMSELIKRAGPLLQHCDELLDGKGSANANELRREGEGIYARKPNKLTNNVTWSQKEYAHLGFQYEYLALKSVQRFTETWALIERAHRAGLLDRIISKADGSSSGTVGGAGNRGRRLVIASLGGGPGFELLAIEKFLQLHYGDSITAELVSLDLEESWDPYVRLLGYKFRKWDIQKGEFVSDVREALGTGATEDFKVDFVVISYVFYHYMRSKESIDMLKNYLEKESGNAVLISTRFEKLVDRVRELEDRGLKVVKLIDQGWGRDDRQLVVLPSRFEADEAAKRQNGPPAFPNVPYEEHKPKRKFNQNRRSHHRREGHTGDVKRSRDRERDRRHGEYHGNHERLDKRQQGPRDRQHRDASRTSRPNHRRDDRQRGRDPRMRLEECRDAFEHIYGMAGRVLDGLDPDERRNSRQARPLTFVMELYDKFGRETSSRTEPNVEKRVARAESRGQKLLRMLDEWIVDLQKGNHPLSRKIVKELRALHSLALETWRPSHQRRRR